MNGAHYHLIVNHLPLIFPLVGLVVVLIGIFSKSEAVKRTGYVIFILGSVCTILAMTTGEQAEEVVEKIAGIDENFIETHEEAAETFALLNYVLGVVSAIGLWLSFSKPKYSGPISMTITALAIVTLFFAAQTGTTGGEIRHTEIRSESSINIIPDENLESEDH